MTDPLRYRAYIRLVFALSATNAQFGHSEETFNVITNYLAKQVVQ